MTCRNTERGRELRTPLKKKTEEETESTCATTRKNRETDMGGGFKMRGRRKKLSPRKESFLHQSGGGDLLKKKGGGGIRKCPGDLPHSKMGGDMDPHEILAEESTGFSTIQGEELDLGRGGEGGVAQFKKMSSHQ